MSLTPEQAAVINAAKAVAAHRLVEIDDPVPWFETATRLDTEMCLAVDRLAACSSPTDADYREESDGTLTVGPVPVDAGATSAGDEHNPRLTACES